VAAGLGLSAHALAQRGLRTHGARIIHFSLASRFVGRTLEETAVVPRGASPRRPRPLLVLLHWRGGSPDGLLSNELLEALWALGPRAPIVLMPNGSGGSFWHDRRGGRWAHYVVAEAIPAAVRRLGADPSRVAIGGTSMGGFGALDIARLWPGRFCAVGAHSPALFLSARELMPGSFDGRSDFSDHDLLALHPHYGRMPVWIDVGADDRFRRADVRLATVMGVTPHVWPGGHGTRYWRSHMADYLGFYADALARCHGATRQVPRPLPRSNRDAGTSPPPGASARARHGGGFERSGRQSRAHRRSGGGPLHRGLGS
jgi:predicted esterase